MSLEMTYQRISPSIKKIAEHPLFHSIHHLDALRIFTEHHVFAVWDFMCLLKGLQRELTCTTLPWLPPKNGLGAHLVNTLLADEEGDIHLHGQYMSHFEMYLNAMEDIGANTLAINTLMHKLSQNEPVEQALNLEVIPAPSRAFVKATFTLIAKPVHQMAAAFLFGRENITAKMFQPILAHLTDTSNHCLQSICYYFKRHIELDEADHSQKAALLLQNLCGNDPKKWQDVEDAALFALAARYDLLEGIYQAIQAKLAIAS